MDTVLVGLRVVLSLGVVLALLYVLQKRIAKGGRTGRRTSPVTVVARQGIGAKASVVVVDVEGERLVLGVTDASVTVLAAADRPVEPAALELVAAPAEPAVPEARVTPIAPVPTFSDVLSADRGASSGALAAPDRPRNGTSTGTEPAMLRPRGAERRAATARRHAPRDLDARRGGRAAKALDGSILAPDTWRQAAAALRSGRAG